MPLKLALPLAAALALACCRAPARPDAARPEAAPAAKDAAACRRTGCGGQVCAAEDVMTTCEWRPEHDCWRAARCERQADGACGFTPDPELERCLAKARAGGEGKPVPFE